METALIVSILTNIVTLGGLFINIKLNKKNLIAADNKVKLSIIQEYKKKEYFDSIDFIANAENLRFTTIRIMKIIESVIKENIKYDDKIFKMLCDDFDNLSSIVFKDWFKAAQHDFAKSDEIIIKLIHNGKNLVVSFSSFIRMGLLDNCLDHPFMENSKNNLNILKEDRFAKNQA